jgi:tetratricopeptide (TPR) repeat protein
VTSFIVALVFRYKRKEFLFKNNFIFYFLASLGTIILSIIIIRGSPLFGLIFLPAISANLSDIFIELKIRFVSTKKELLLFIAIILAMLALLCGPYFANWWRGFKTNGLRIGITKHSESAARFWLDNKLKGPIFNDTDIGSYLIYYLYPEEKVFTDNRFGDAYSGDFFSNIFLPIMADEERWEEAAETYKFNAIFWYQYDRGQNARDFLFRRMNDPGWAVVYADEYALIILKRVPENEDIINKFEITRLNAADRLGDLAGADDFDSQVAAADLFSLMGRTDLAMDQYYKVVSRWPDRGRVWMIIGEILLTSTNENIQNPYLAMLALERALANGWKSTEAYSYLALAYYRTSQIDRARAAVDEELQIDPDSADGQRWLGILAGEPLAPEH